MLVTFSCPAYADITMFGDVAVRLIKLMGHSGTVPGALLAADVQAALARLEAAVEADTQSPKPEPDASAQKEDGDREQHQRCADHPQQKDMRIGRVGLAAAGQDPHDRIVERREGGRVLVALEVRAAAPVPAGAAPRLRRDHGLQRLQ